MRSTILGTIFKNTSCVLFLSILVSCSSKSGDAQNSFLNARKLQSGNMQAISGVTETDTGKSIDLPHYVPDFPPGPGQELFMNRCGVCHSLRYVTMQPDFPRKTWSKEVDKMIHTYGAHITKEEAEQITEYLWTIKGKKDASAK
jgi:mono/diheme cytochrome c family protein